MNLLIEQVIDESLTDQGKVCRQTTYRWHADAWNESVATMDGAAITSRRRSSSPASHASVVAASQGSTGVQA